MTDKQTYKVQICCGTMCYIMGGAEIHLLNEKLPVELKERVSIEGIPCLGNCEDNAEKAHPCVLINGETMPKASIQKIINHLLSTIH
ncbi:NAD(P)H-dependent oxidoreductase subunit E [Carboxylicivirga sp. N1Y90]|uniref:NAD(P)H-dependent oxidoreductase subunit E n=1 Tax=Carboxylicivirga fragile TaxID=3417571 RepID=UPI003D33A2F3|nr:NAD(P)H-dependent oxidoreductase subunit E [Marinilabiliaceae bacterium N1Y90]